MGLAPILIHKIYLLLFLGKQRHENFIMRHGEAEVVSSSDEARHLTDYGRKQSILQGQWL